MVSISYNRKIIKFSAQIQFQFDFHSLSLSADTSGDRMSDYDTRRDVAQTDI